MRSTGGLLIFLVALTGAATLAPVGAEPVPEGGSFNASFVQQVEPTQCRARLDSFGVGLAGTIDRDGQPWVIEIGTDWDTTLSLTGTGCASLGRQSGTVATTGWFYGTARGVDGTVQRVTGALTGAYERTSANLRMELDATLSFCTGGLYNEPCPTEPVVERLMVDGVLHEALPTPSAIEFQYKTEYEAAWRTG